MPSATDQSCEAFRMLHGSNGFAIKRNNDIERVNVATAWNMIFKYFEVHVRG